MYETWDLITKTAFQSNLQKARTKNIKFLNETTDILFMGNHITLTLFLLIFSLNSYTQGNDLTGVGNFPETDSEGFRAILVCGEIKDRAKPNTVISAKELDNGTVLIKIRYIEDNITINIPASASTVTETNANFSLINPGRKSNSYSFELNTGVGVEFEETRWPDYFSSVSAIMTRLLNNNYHIDRLTFTQSEPSSLWIQGYLPYKSRQDRVVEDCHILSKSFIQEAIEAKREKDNNQAEVNSSTIKSKDSNPAPTNDKKGNSQKVIQQ